MSQSSKTKERSIKSKAKKNICKTCNQDITSNKKNDALTYKNTYHRRLAKNHCKDHKFTYSNHKCKPHWCGDCDYLIKYEIEIQKG
jgi:hypothetical protein